MATAREITKFLQKRGISVSKVEKKEDGLVVYTNKPKQAAKIFSIIADNSPVVFVANRPLWLRIIRLGR